MWILKNLPRENSKHHADVVEYEEDTNPGGGQVTTESNLVEN